MSTVLHSEETDNVKIKQYVPCNMPTFLLKKDSDEQYMYLSLPFVTKQRFNAAKKE